MEKCDKRLDKLSHGLSGEFCNLSQDVEMFKKKAFACKQSDCKSGIGSACVVNGVGSKKDERLALIRQLLNESWPIII